ncbi:hypothetical protein chiPu_0009412 [Chiloscyllium punctatum]|uniref:Uncharacterized protein n=1 Tax=Chiloscyllium punctatum TaxID=137246 RepID=A0A401SKQ4_CHIPU|nr:hypothetical protein [Chiloscyllium punctatum]
MDRVPERKQSEYGLILEQEQSESGPSPGTGAKMSMDRVLEREQSEYGLIPEREQSEYGPSPGAGAE